ncbi:transporter substrate-binding domain-containing protein [Halocella sp. SP3-1]|uniref:transporter substrate-binding domain-containing protein n=1 Tax=Halocella sp. SP3-1 TaxID=2382161 RepID=UPI000F7626D6|nr:transporter substrate-binding domain-containing protein [Halocella sp. SP3-1]AZO94338.1 ABC transporter substrate-binding protein [Halocella sp. SP3-1]
MKNKKIVLLSLLLLLVITMFSSFTIYAASLTEVIEKGEISFAMSGGYPPFNFYNEHNELVGYDVDVAAEIASRLGVEFEPVTTAWDGIIEGLRAGRYDGILGSMAITPSRLEVVDFSIPYYYSGAQLIVADDSLIETPADIDGKTVGVTTGTTFAEDARKLGAKINLYEDDNQTLMELMNGRIDGVISDRMVGVGFKNKGYAVKMAGELLRTEDIAVAFRKEDSTLLVEVNKILLEMHKDGTLAGIGDKWFGMDITLK